MNIYDTIKADSIEAGDQIIIDGNPIEVNEVEDEDNFVVVKGFSHEAGDNVTIVLEFDEFVDLWGI